MNESDEERLLGTITLTSLKTYPEGLPKLGWRKIEQRTDRGNFEFYLNGHKVTIGPIKSSFWMLTKHKYLPYIHAVLEWFVKNESLIHQVIIDDSYEELSRTITQTMQWYCSEKYEEYLENFPLLADSQFDIEDPEQREQIISKRELLRHTAVTEIGMDYEKNQITKIVLYYTYVPAQDVSEKISLIMAEYEDVSVVESAYNVEWDKSE